MIALLSAPSNLGLRPPQPGSVPGTAKAPEALREAGLHERFGRLGVLDAGAVLPGRYVDDDATRPPGFVRNEVALVDHARRLAVRLEAVRAAGHAPLVLGGDCSLLVGVGIANARSWRAGLVHVDGHTDFRHPGGAEPVASVAGEDLAAAIGLHTAAVSDVDGLAPYFDHRRTVHLGCRDDDEEREEVAGAIADLLPVTEVRRVGLDAAVARVRAGTANRPYWLQLDVDVLDTSVLPAVDSPAPGGLVPDELVALLQALAPGAVGASVTVFDPDLGLDGRYAALLTKVLVEGFGALGAVV
ncbi:arginase family protein [Amnibacterium soli]|uniref:Arginase family protein n=1 Tax=Amnibacterium soli TaxID=1282736 RepID=A0ABP8Z154_9MICO